MELEFYRCKHCGQIIAIVKGTGVPVVCCGEKMEKIVPGTTDAAAEKHVPVVEVNGNIATVKVGSVAHPMIEEHYIEWIVLQTESGNQRKQLKPGQEPKAEFALLDGEKVVSAYAYCNLHSLWKA
jgi:superoxide reductase